MKLLYLDCAMGAAGDMLAGALIGLAPDPEAALASLNALGVPHCRYELERLDKCGIAATHLSVKIHGEEEENAHHRHSGRSLAAILETVRSLALGRQAKENAVAVYRSLADAEAQAHGRPVDEIHFHEVGALDAIADIAAVCFLLDALGADETVVSPVNVGGGTARCAHGEMPVPAPATAILLKGVPAYSDGTSELCTPTGAALLSRFATRYGPMPPMRTAAIGCGAGRRDLPRPNIVRAFLGESAAAGDGDAVSELVFTVDDMTGEDLAYAAGRIVAAGALDVTFSPVFMKKGRPGYEVAVLCAEEVRDAAIRAVFANTSTIGLRERVCRRHLLGRRIEEVVLPDGTSARRKISEGFGARRAKFEADDVAAYASAHGISMQSARKTMEETT